MFQLHKKLAEDSIHICDLKLSQLLLMNDKRYPWCILVPKKPNLVELYDLDNNDQKVLLHEIKIISDLIKVKDGIRKMNIALLGNKVKQLHVHVIGRSENDYAWPDTVWDKGTKEKYTQNEITSLVHEFKQGYVKY